ncbi:MAG: hypothetical protein MI748_10550, partial [Opitutales bacterium]|nr:hypothetical protein [Opitutales bacterium]
DRDLRFTSEFWRHVFRSMKVQVATTTANHPEADGQSENRVKVVRTMLRSFAAEYHGEWDLRLPILEMQYNNSKNATTGLTPFETIYGINVRTPVDLMSQSTEMIDSDAKSFLDQIYRNTATAQKAIEEKQMIQKEQADKHRREQVFEIGDLVLLSTKHL